MEDVGWDYIRQSVRVIAVENVTKLDVTKFIVFWYILPRSQVDVNISLTTQQYVPEDYKLHTRRRENLKSHIAVTKFIRRHF
jgi:hypothetical protein